MTYMDHLSGASRTHAPVIPAGSFSTTRDARRVSSAREMRAYEDSSAFRATRSLMSNRTGVCG